MNNEVDSMRKLMVQVHESFKAIKEWMDGQPEQVQSSLIKACRSSAGRCFCGCHEGTITMGLAALWHTADPPTPEELEGPIVINGGFVEDEPDQETL